MKNNPKGFTLLFAVLVASLLLAVGFTIFDITYKESIFSSIARNSNFAIYAADSGRECAEYWDRNCPANTSESCNDTGSAFATSTDHSLIPSGSGKLLCNGTDIIAQPWVITTSGPTTTTTFQFNLGPNNLYCVAVEVDKGNNPINTLITARGYNTSCPSGPNDNNPNRLERALQDSY